MKSCVLWNFCIWPYLQQKLFELRSSGLLWAVNPMTSVLKEEEKGRQHTKENPRRQRQRWEPRTCQLDSARDGWWLPRAGNSSSHRAPRSQLHQHLVALASGAITEPSAAVWRHSVAGHLWQKPWKMITVQATQRREGSRRRGEETFTMHAGLWKEDRKRPAEWTWVLTLCVFASWPRGNAVQTEAGGGQPCGGPNTGSPKCQGFYSAVIGLGAFSTTAERKQCHLGKQQFHVYK